MELAFSRMASVALSVSSPAFSSISSSSWDCAELTAFFATDSMDPATPVTASLTVLSKVDFISVSFCVNAPWITPLISSPLGTETESIALKASARAFSTIVSTLFCNVDFRDCPISPARSSFTEASTSPRRLSN